jgi:hypothetical protein
LVYGLLGHPTRREGVWCGVGRRKGSGRYGSRGWPPTTTPCARVGDGVSACGLRCLTPGPCSTYYCTHASTDSMHLFRSLLAHQRSRAGLCSSIYLPLLARPSQRAACMHAEAQCEFGMYQACRCRPGTSPTEPSRPCGRARRVEVLLDERTTHLCRDAVLRTGGTLLFVRARRW